MSSEQLDLGAKYGETTLSNFEVFMIGEAIVTWLATTVRLGHTSPGSLLDYTRKADALGLGGLIARDFVAWTSGRKHLAEGCEERMRDLAASAELDRECAARADSAIAGRAS